MADFPRTAVSSVAETQRDQSLVDEVIAGLHKHPKELSPLWLYDEVGSQLFDMICELPEYYLTRAELAIMDKHGDEMADAIGPGAAIVEFGSGTSDKTRLLLDHLDAPVVYVPVDIARVHLAEAAAAIAHAYPGIDVVPVNADFSKPIALPLLAQASARKVIYFPGSTIGNFAPASACALLHLMAELVDVDGAMLIGIDLKKDSGVLERAYNDAAGITSRFNLNALRHLNRMTDADFPLSAFQHQAVWVADLNRIEMRLMCTRDVQAHVGDETFEVQKGEYILTECCHKYTIESFAKLAASAALRIRHRWLDRKKRFSVLLLEPVDEAEVRDDGFKRELAAFRASLDCLSPTD